MLKGSYFSFNYSAIEGECITAHVIRGNLNISTTIPSGEENSTVLRPLEGRLQDYVKKIELCSSSTVFSMHMKCSLIHNMMTTTLVTQCRSCAEQTSQQQATSSCFVSEGGEGAAERFGVSVMFHSFNLGLVKVL